MGRKSIRPVVDLPAGLDPSGLALVSAFTSLPSVPTAPVLVIPDQGPSLVSFLSTAPEGLVFLGAVSPDEPNPRLDSHSAATALLMVALAVWQRPDRAAAYAAIRAHAATTTLASIIATRIAANPRALAENDTDLLAAIETAASAVGPALPPLDPGRSTPNQRPEKSRTRSFPDPPVPHHEFAFGNQGAVNLPFPGVSLERAMATESTRLPDYFVTTSESRLIHCIFFGKLFSESALPTGIDPLWIPATNYADPRISANQCLTGVAIEESMTLEPIMVRPLFGASNTGLIGIPKFEPLSETLLELLETCWALSVWRITADFLLDALGFGGASFTLSDLRSSFAILEGGDSTIQSALNLAQSGQNMPDAAKALILACASSIGQAELTVQALQRLVPASGSISALQSVAARRLIAFVTQSPIYSLAARFGAQFADHKAGILDRPLTAYTELGGKNPAVIVVAFSPKTTSSTYESAGNPIDIEFISTPIDYSTSYSETLRYRYKLFGAGQGVLDDGKGQRGREFESTSHKVRFIPAADSTGVQSIGMEASLVYGNVRRPSASSKVELNDGGSAGGFALAPQLTRVRPGRFRDILVTRNGVSNMQGWNDINLANLSFIWVLANDEVGTLSSGNLNGLEIETKTNAVRITSPEQTWVGGETALQVIVRLTDPATGQFTNLAVLNGRVASDVRDSAQISVRDSSLPLSELGDGTSLRNYNRTTGTIVKNGGKLDCAGEYSRGSKDQLLAYFNLDSATEGSGFLVTAPEDTLQWIVFSSGGSKVYTFELRGNVSLFRVSRDASNNVNYIQMSGVFTGTDATSGATVEVDATWSYGTPPNDA